LGQRPNWRNGFDIFVLTFLFCLAPIPLGVGSFALLFLKAIFLKAILGIFKKVNLINKFI
jgi:hypothetical protein